VTPVTWHGVDHSDHSLWQIYVSPFWQLKLELAAIAKLHRSVRNVSYVHAGNPSFTTPTPNASLSPFIISCCSKILCLPAPLKVLTLLCPCSSALHCQSPLNADLKAFAAEMQYWEIQSCHDEHTRIDPDHLSMSVAEEMFNLTFPKLPPTRSTVLWIPNPRPERTRPGRIFEELSCSKR
jgi:hypothetical protein